MSCYYSPNTALLIYGIYIGSREGEPEFRIAVRVAEAGRCVAGCCKE